MVKKFQPSAVCNVYNHELKKVTLMQYSNYCMEDLVINRFVESVWQSFLKLKTIPNDLEGFLIEECLEKAVTETNAEVMLGGRTEYDLLQKWNKKALLLRGFPRFIRKLGEEGIANKLSEIFKAAPYVQKVRSPLDHDCLLSWCRNWHFTDGHHFAHLLNLSSDAFFVCQKLQSLLKINWGIFQFEEKSFRFLDNLHCISKFYLEAHRLFHPPATNCSDAIKYFFFESSSRYVQLRRRDLLIGNRQAAPREPSSFEQP